MPGDAIVFAGLMAHAPILVPGVGKENLAFAGATARAMEVVARRAAAARPDAIVVISPHSPRRPGAFGIWRGPRLRGSLEDFGAPGDRVDLPVDEELAHRLEAEATAGKLRTWEIAGEPLDHGAIVPLCYLVAAGWKGPTVVVGLNYPDEGGLAELGRAIAAAARALGRRVAVVASGDMSHRLTRSAPGGFHPDAHRFDETFVAALRAGKPDGLGRIDPALREAAGEDVVDSTRIALAASGERTEGHQLLSYEGPFGVGYGVAILFEPARAPAGSRLDDLTAVARSAIEAGVRGESGAPPFAAAGELTQRRGVFVTLWTESGDLRGCMGSPAPSQPDLVGETWESARLAAFHDFRFPAVRGREVDRLRISVTILGDLEPVASPADLDPAVYGVVVRASDGRRALLLPGIEGIDSVAKQLEITRRKAGIRPDEPIEIQRFSARSVEEPPRGARP
jgi:AmmeMemoRadiSam system protein A